MAALFTLSLDIWLSSFSEILKSNRFISSYQNLRTHQFFNFRVMISKKKKVPRLSFLLSELTTTYFESSHSLLTYWRSLLIARIEIHIHFQSIYFNHSLVNNGAIINKCQFPVYSWKEINDFGFPLRPSKEIGFPIENFPRTCTDSNGNLLTGKIYLNIKMRLCYVKIELDII